MPTTYKAFFLSVDKVILNGKPYSHDDLDKLPPELRPSNTATVTKNNITAFYSRHSKLSNHFPCKFTTGEGEFTSVEQYLMYQKAIHFGDNLSASTIRQTDDPVTVKNLGKTIKNFKPEVWKGVREQYMQVGISAKFEQNLQLAQYLKETGDSTLVEANPFDNYWGVGLSMSNEDVWIKTNWKGANKLGQMLEELRESITTKI